MELLCKTCLLKLPLMLLHGTVIQKLLCKAISQAFAWDCHAEAVLRSYLLNFCMTQSRKSCFASFCMQLSRKSCLWALLLKLLHGTVMQTWLFKAIPWAFQLVWNCHTNKCFAKHSLKIEFRSVSPSCSIVLLNNARGLGRRASKMTNPHWQLFCRALCTRQMTHLSRDSTTRTTSNHGPCHVALVAWLLELWCKGCFANLVNSFCMELLQKLLCEAFS